MASITISKIRRSEYLGFISEYRNSSDRKIRYSEMLATEAKGKASLVRRSDCVNPVQGVADGGNQTRSSLFGRRLVYEAMEDHSPRLNDKPICLCVFDVSLGLASADR